MSDLFDGSAAEGDRELATAVASIDRGVTDSGGALLSAFSVRYIALQRGATAQHWLQQRDLALIRSEASYLLLENTAKLPRAGLFDRLPPIVGALAADNPARDAVPSARLITSASRDGAGEFSVRHAAGPAVVFLAEARNPWWQATLGARPLERIRGGWANAFVAPAASSGPLKIYFRGSTSLLWWRGLFFVGWLIALGAVRSGGARPTASSAEPSA